MEKNNKPIFSYNPDISKNAYMNWRIYGHSIADNLVVLESGFEEAAKQLMKSVLDDNRLKQADVLIFPIMYAIDQSIELYLKAIVYNLEQLETGTPNNYKTHDIQSLFTTMMSLIKKQEQKTKGLQAHVAPLKEYIEELYSHIVNSKGKVQMDFARYPFDTDMRLPLNFPLLWYMQRRITLPFCDYWYLSPLFHFLSQLRFAFLRQIVSHS